MAPARLSRHGPEPGGRYARRATCYHLRCVIDVWGTGFQMICRDCGSYVEPPPLTADQRRCGCYHDPAVFGHLHGL